MLKPSIRLLSISDCRDKTGIVTFIRIFQQKYLEGALPGFHLGIDCYRDFVETGMASPPGGPSPVPIQAPVQGNRRSRRLDLKIRVKNALLGNRFGAFLLFVHILCKRGLFVAIKSRLRGTAEIYFHQDFLTALWGRIFLPSRARSILVLHSGADPLKQLFIVFQGMKDTCFERAIRASFGWVLRKQDMVITLSKALAEEIRTSYGVADVRCIYNTAVQLETAGRAGPSNTACLSLVAVGSLQHVKGFDILLEAIALLGAEQRSRVALTIVGEGEERKRLEECILSNGLEANIALVGNSNNVPAYLRQADVFVLSSRDEGMPMAVLEAMQVGLPLISTKVGTIPEVLDSSACVFVDKQPADIARVIGEILDGAYDLDAMSKASREIYDNKLSMALFLNSYISAFRDVQRKGQQVWQ